MNNRYFFLLPLLLFVGCASQVQELNEQGLQFAQKGQYQQALEKFSKAHKQAPDDYKTNYNLANTYIHLKKYQQALNLVQKILQKKPKDANGQLMLAQIYFFQNQHEKTEKILKSLAKTEQKNEQVYLAIMGMGEFYFRQGNMKQSAHWFQLATQVQPKNTQGYIRLAESYIAEIMKNSKDPSQIAKHKKELDAAEATLLKIVYLDKENFQAHVMLGGLSFYLGKYEKAALSLKEALQLRPNDLGVLLLLGQNEQMHKKYQQAEKYYLNAKTSFPTRPEPILYLALLKIEEKKYKKAVYLFIEIEEKLSQMEMPTGKKEEFLLQMFKANFSTHFSWLVDMLNDKDPKISSFVKKILKQISGENFTTKEQWEKWRQNAK